MFVVTGLAAPETIPSLTWDGGWAFHIVQHHWPVV